MLQNSFYTIEKTESTDSIYRASVLLNSSHEIFKAHFPENPITPGVCLLQMSIELLNAKFDRSFRLTSSKSIKYLKVINPNENPKIEFVFNYKIENDLIIADISIVAGELTFTKISAVYKG